MGKVTCMLTMIGKTSTEWNVICWYSDIPTGRETGEQGQD